MKLRRRLTREHEVIIAIYVARAFKDTVEICLERGKGEIAAPTGKIIDEPWKVLGWLPGYCAKDYDQEYLTTTKPAHARIKRYAQDFAKDKIDEMREKNKYTDAQLRAALPHGT